MKKLTCVKNKHEVKLRYTLNYLTYIVLRGCLCDNWKPSFLHLLIFNWRIFSRRVTARWWRQWAKNQVLTKQNSRNRWCQIVRQTVCKFWIHVGICKIFIGNNVKMWTCPQGNEDPKSGKGSFWTVSRNPNLCFPANFAKFLQTPFLTEHFQWLLLHKLLQVIYICQVIYTEFH